MTSFTITGASTVSTNQIFAYQITDIVGTPHIYNWVVKNGEIISGQFTNTINVKWDRKFKEGKITVAVDELINVKYVSLYSDISDVPVLYNTCLDKCNKITGTGAFNSIIKMYSSGKLIYQTTTNENGVFLIDNVCVDNLQISQIENNKSESDKLQLQPCINCQTPVKRYIRDYSVNCL